jgi:hypothetical protein
MKKNLLTAITIIAIMSCFVGWPCSEHGLHFGFFWKLCAFIAENM